MSVYKLLGASGLGKKRDSATIKDISFEKKPMRLNCYNGQSNKFESAIAYARRKTTNPGYPPYSQMNEFFFAVNLYCHMHGRSASTPTASTIPEECYFSQTNSHRWRCCPRRTPLRLMQYFSENRYDSSFDAESVTLIQQNWQFT